MTVKNELCRHENLDECCLFSELAATVGINGSISISGDDGVSLRIVTENAAFARRIYSQLKRLDDIVPNVIIRKSKKLKKHTTYILVVTSGAGSDKLLENTGLSASDSSESGHAGLHFSDNRIRKRTCCRKAFLRGAFLSGGAISDPEKTYHLEITTRSLNIAQEIKRILGTFKLNAKIIVRKGSYVTYLKEGENIVDFLNIVGAHSALMELENVRILKGMRNSVNRIVNCETANLEKTVNASVRQIDNIKYLIENCGIGKLPENLREIAELRLKYSEASLLELGQLMSPPLGKSGVNHRLRKIDIIAEDERLARGE
jgi:DNA-binding protein WhiA